MTDVENGPYELAGDNDPIAILPAADKHFNLRYLNLRSYVFYLFNLFLSLPPFGQILIMIH